PQGAGETLEAALDDVMAVLAINALDMQGQPGMLRESTEPLLEQLAIDAADRGALEGDLPDQIWPVGGVERDPRQRLVHRDQRGAITADAGAIAQRLGHRLTQHNAGILDRMVLVDMQIAFRVQFDIDETVPGKLLQHMVEEADPGDNASSTGAV